MLRRRQHLERTLGILRTHLAIEFALCADLEHTHATTQPSQALHNHRSSIIIQSHLC
jgi:hypothetical protein